MLSPLLKIALWLWTMLSPEYSIVTYAISWRQHCGLCYLMKIAIVNYAISWRLHCRICYFLEKKAKLLCVVQSTSDQNLWLFESPSHQIFHRKKSIVPLLLSHILILTVSISISLFWYLRFEKDCTKKSANWMNSGDIMTLYRSFIVRNIYWRLQQILYSYY